MSLQSITQSALSAVLTATRNAVDSIFEAAENNVPAEIENYGPEMVTFLSQFAGPYAPEVEGLLMLVEKAEVPVIAENAAKGLVMVQNRIDGFLVEAGAEPTEPTGGSATEPTKSAEPTEPTVASVPKPTVATGKPTGVITKPT